MAEKPGAVLYWDASAVLSVLFRDTNTMKALGVIRRRAAHLVSTLAYAEVLAVVARLERGRDVPRSLASAARVALRGAPWQALLLQPDRGLIDQMALGASLRGADLWHLATASTLAREVPEVRVITFDSRLRSAATSVGLALGQRTS